METNAVGEHAVAPDLSDHPPRRGPVLGGRSELIYEVRRAAGLTQQQAETVVKAYEAAILTALNRGETVRLPGVGALAMTPVPERVVRNPRTNEMLVKPAGFKPRFRPAAALKGVKSA